ncbi:hypothetical protein BL250_12970 [Erwinia sp. OLTSP20]|uniref:YceK/YidQ family lipoprotein n=1 Tax=unclassified Erwinia TaxID=2622719 RepID=UPI000C1A153A|nr:MULTISPECIES: YceK/YidQ family lipoprotein [unclassified Erwinia]PIJ49587.1 hypothetical protein BV501_12210 [Erwinia sp. OAMSP11]PIJ72321.1 hypothetical protein BK416_09815 [Erwinia sp. OLSSP12]PIJ81629.1 hypothetical protein BLD49_16295 [Erwinia sp. OLMDSP33]PIJ81680.1 hypothetical protein BLD47_08385 [Erwinia sp. OLCASP19]PIJ82032.1 hypothetical protein BLD46_11900 [Erwinia sp. OLMTSP26]
MIVLKKFRLAGMVVLLSLASSGCSSIMTHTGPDQGYYPGTRASAKMVADSENGWPLRSLAALDLPFSALLDTLLLPLDYMRSGSDKSQDSPRERVLRSEKFTHTEQSLSGAAPLVANTHQQ